MDSILHDFKTTVLMRSMIKREIILITFGLIGFMLTYAQSVDTILVNEDIQLIHLQDSIYVHKSWHTSENFGRFPSNGMIIIRNGQALMIDTPMDNSKTESLVNYLKDSLSVDLKKLIIGHFHNDCMGGLEYLQSMGVESIASSLTVDRCKEIGLPVPSTPFSDSLSFNFFDEQIVCRYFGAGHSHDNITVWMPDKLILFGGCLVKSLNSKGLGNLSNAVVSEWDLTIEKLRNHYENIKTVIPGHGAFGGPELLNHTLQLVKSKKTVN